MKIGYLGPEGSYTHIAATKACKDLELEDSSFDFVGVESTLGLIELIEDIGGHIDYGVLPIENSIEGSVRETIDRLVDTDNVYINQELKIPIKHCLLTHSLEVEDLSKVTQVFAHPMSFAQCRNFLKEYYPNARHVTCASNSAAARIVANEYKDSDEMVAAIGSEFNSELYNLKIAAREINDEKSNETRFWLVSRNPVTELGKQKLADKKRETYKTTVVFQAKDKPGALIDVLTYISGAGINMTRIESRPSRKVLGEYMFHVDMAIHREDDVFVNTVSEIKKHLSFYKCLGSYNVLK